MANHETWIKRLELPSNELTILAAQVNDICRLEPGDFMPEKHLPEFTNIIHHLDTHLSVKSLFWADIINNKDENSTPVRGVRGLTDRGISLQVPDQKKQSREVIRLGKRDGIGIGYYIVEKELVKRGLRSLTFNYFLDYSVAIIDPELEKPHYRLIYKKDSLEPVEFSKEIPQVHWFGTSYIVFPIWSDS
jgi:hypothetical protein